MTLTLKSGFVTHHFDILSDFSTVLCILSETKVRQIVCVSEPKSFMLRTRR
jgi:hypothetical protein